MRVEKQRSRLQRLLILTCNHGPHSPGRVPLTLADGTGCLRIVSSQQHLEQGPALIRSMLFDQPGQQVLIVQLSVVVAEAVDHRAHKDHGNVIGGPGLGLEIMDHELLRQPLLRIQVDLPQPAIDAIGVASEYLQVFRRQACELVSNGLG
ncbi:hypothetical protein D3C80_710710 [compost metagenome]